MAEHKVDVLIIGSGHSGGLAAKVLTEKGISCTMLNAGPMMNFERDRELKPAFELPYRGFDAPGRLPHVFQASEFSANQWVDEKEIPYTYPVRAGQYNWVRVRTFGGRSPYWGRQSFRHSDFRAEGQEPRRLRRRLADFDYAELKPFYDRVEPLYRVRGAIDHLPQYPDGNFIIDDAPFSPAMKRFRGCRLSKRGVPVTKPRSSVGVNGMAASINLFIPDAVKTGKLTTRSPTSS